MKIWCFNDKQSKWGAMLFLAAWQRGHDARLFGHPRQVTEPGFAFWRLEQDPVRLAGQRRHALHILDLPGVIGIQKREAIMEYENKVYQTKKFSYWMPETYFVNQQKNSSWTANELGFPFVSKSRTGSGCAGVRIIPDMKAALEEAEAVFNGGLKAGRELQEGYLLWQKFLPGNEYSYRVARIGNYYMMIRINNRPDVPLSSGSGNYQPVLLERPEEHAAFNFGVRFLDTADAKWGGCDLLYDREVGEWRAIETTLAWNLHVHGGTMDCPVFDKNGVPTEPAWKGVHQFEILLHELERGVFDG